MKLFLVWVQLSDKNTGYYSLLKDKLIEAGFKKRITFIEGVEYWLPNGNYKIETDKSPSGVLTDVSK